MCCCWFLWRHLGSEQSLTQILPNGVWDRGITPEPFYCIPTLLPVRQTKPGVTFVTLQWHHRKWSTASHWDQIVSLCDSYVLVRLWKESDSGGVTISLLHLFRLPLFQSMLHIYLPRFLHCPPGPNWMISKPRLQVVEGVKSCAISCWNCHRQSLITNLQQGLLHFGFHLQVTLWLKEQNKTFYTWFKDRMWCTKYKLINSKFVSNTN